MEAVRTHDNTGTWGGDSGGVKGPLKLHSQGILSFCAFLLLLRGRDPPLHAVRESRAVVGGGGVMSAHGIEEVIVGGHAHTSSPLGHGCTHAPLVGVRIEALHRPQT